MNFLKSLLIILIGTTSTMFGVDMVYSFYPTTLRVSSVGETFMVFTNPYDDNISYHVADKPEDMMEGDLVSCIMYDMRHNGNIVDDKVVTWRYAGW